MTRTDPQPNVIDQSGHLNSPPPPPSTPASQTGRLSRAILVVLAAATGLVLMADSLMKSSATYDEVMYLSVASHWWRTGDQVRITRAGSPLTFWKLQQAPMLWTLDQIGFGEWIDHPEKFEVILLPLARLAALWVWLVALALVVYWSRRLYGPLRDGPGGMVVRPEPKHPGARPPDHHGDPDHRGDDRHDAPVLGLPSDR